MYQFRHLTDDEVESLWAEAHKHIVRTFSDVPIVKNDDDTSSRAIAEYLHRQEALEVVDAEFRHRYDRRRKASGAATRREKGYTILGGRTGSDIRIASHDEMVGLEVLGVVRKPGRPSDKWCWRVYQCPGGYKSEGTSNSLDGAKAEVEKRIERWFQNCRIDRRAAGVTAANTA